MVFLGGAVLANIVSPSFSLFSDIQICSLLRQMADKHDMWVSKAEWEEQGERAMEKLGPR